MPTISPPAPTNGSDRRLDAPSVLARPVSDASTGEGIDRRRARRRVTPRRVGLALALVAVVALVVFAWPTGEQTVRVDGASLTLATAEEGPFQEHVSALATVRPLRTVFLDAVVGGQVARRLVDEGDTVRAGQPLFVLQNDEVALQVVSQEAQLEEQAAALRQNRLALDKTATEGAQAALAVDRTLAELDYEIARLTRERDRTAGLVERGATATQDLDALAGELAYAQRRRALALRERDLTAAARHHDGAQRTAQLRDMEASVGRLRQNLSLVRSTTSDLVVRAPVDGQFSALEAEVGELKPRGARLGQVDVLAETKLRASIAEHYLARVAPGQPGTATVDGVTYALRVRTVYPEVAAGRFEAELVFDGPAPPALRRGQSVRVRIELGAPEPALLIPAGRYTRSAADGLFVLAPDGRTARRRVVTLGRQSPTHVEVLDGLAPGERVVTSATAPFGDAAILVLQ